MNLPASVDSALESPPPCVVFEDAHLLVVDKPSGWNTHAPAPHAGEGIYDWLRHRDPRWASLAILHRLDKETSGLMVFGKSPEANRSLTAQFTERAVDKRYECVTDRLVEGDEFRVTTSIRREGTRYEAVSASLGGDPAETWFRVVRRQGGLTWLEAEPKTGRTHQIRVHAASLGWPLIGDSLYGGTVTGRLHLHARRLTFRHPVTGVELVFERPASFEPEEAAMPAGVALRRAFIDPVHTTAFRWIHGAADGVPGLFVDRLGDWLLIQSDSEEAATTWWSRTQASPEVVRHGIRGVYFKRLNRHVRGSTVPQSCPVRLDGAEAPSVFFARENGLTFEFSFSEGYSVGLFLDQRDNRRRCLRGHVAAGFSLVPEAAGERHWLNCFAYTCGFSVAAAAAGWRTTSLDLSRKYLDWGRRNFTASGLALEGHDFIYGDVFDWLRRLGKKGRRFGAVVLDPPTFSRSKEHGDFRAESDYGGLVASALKVLEPGGVLLASTNAARLEPDRFLFDVQSAVEASGRRIVQQHYVPQGADFPISREEPAYLKTAWFRIS